MPEPTDAQTAIDASRVIESYLKHESELGTLTQGLTLAQRNLMAELKEAERTRRVYDGILSLTWLAFLVSAFLPNARVQDYFTASLWTIVMAYRVVCAVRLSNLRAELRGLRGEE